MTDEMERAWKEYCNAKKVERKATMGEVPAAGGSSPVTGSEALPQTLLRPTAAGWWFTRNPPQNWVPAHVDMTFGMKSYVQIWNGSYLSLEAMEADGWEWAGPLTPPAPQNK